MTTPIPNEMSLGFSEVMEFIDSPFVKLVDGEVFDIKMQYVQMNSNYAIQECFVRQEVYEKLLIAQKLLPQGISLRILDAWRPYKLQKELYKKYFQTIIDTFGLEVKSLHEQQQFIKKYVSYPNNDRMKPPVHTTGGAVDVTLIDENGEPFDMGTDFDSFLDEASTSYYESNKNLRVRDNRRLLYNAMIQAGFTNLPSEWWHYDYGDALWAYYKRQPAMYKGAFTVKEVYESGKRE